jgi:hypothetical protein
MKRSHIKKGMKVIGADGAPVGTIDRVMGDRIRLAMRDSGQGRHAGHHHYIDLSLVAETEGETVRLSANAATAVTFEEEASGKPTSASEWYSFAMNTPTHRTNAKLPEQSLWGALGGIP